MRLLFLLKICAQPCAIKTIVLCLNKPLHSHEVQTTNMRESSKADVAEMATRSKEFATNLEVIEALEFAMDGQEQVRYYLRQARDYFTMAKECLEDAIKQSKPNHNVKN